MSIFVGTFTQNFFNSNVPLTYANIPHPIDKPLKAVEVRGGGTIGGVKSVMEKAGYEEAEQKPSPHFKRQKTKGKFFWD